MSHTFWREASTNNSEGPRLCAVATGKALHPYLTEPPEASQEAEEQRCVCSVGQGKSREVKELAESLLVDSKG